MGKNLRRASREEWASFGDVPSADELKLGALLRIADATEKLAQRHAELMRDRDYYERLSVSRSEEIHQLERSNAALRGVIARMKRAQVAPSKE